MVLILHSWRLLLKLIHDENIGFFIHRCWCYRWWVSELIKLLLVLLWLSERIFIPQLSLRRSSAVLRLRLSFLTSLLRNWLEKWLSSATWPFHYWCWQLLEKFYLWTSWSHWVLLSLWSTWKLWNIVITMGTTRTSSNTISR